ncbi:AsnC family transcriptional regulator [Rhodobacter sp. JA431]|uniref:Lrp/AsnC family transcriptional regulator n=1 Tax=Rhodobacter sp. JA431 TaxID=570013 RepID=UPI000BDB8E61|nr:Lrp/AsnC family transcriptional regulator [Rhodobacter sp. JA431]SOC21181.1 AsnC family transcriptional regulator [Rhodobacter sp. JA431]
MRELDLIDRKIMAELMADATLPVAQVAARVGLSQTPCWKRIQRLEAEGVIEKRVALADPRGLGLGTTLFLLFEAPEHDAAWRHAFRVFVETTPDIMEVWRVAGERNYLLRISAPDMATADAIYTRLTSAMSIGRLDYHVALERVKFSTAYPVDTVSR